MEKIIIVRRIVFWGKYQRTEITLKLAPYSLAVYTKLLEKVNPSGDCCFDKDQYDKAAMVIEHSTVSYDEVDVVNGPEDYIEGYIRGLKMADKYSDVNITVEWMNIKTDSLMCKDDSENIVNQY